MLRITKVTDYGIVLLTRIAQAGRDRPANARDLSRVTHLPLPMVGKILKALARAGLLVSHRGAKGGYSLARGPEAISVAEVIGALEGPIALTECLGEAPSNCSVESCCPVKVSWKRINGAIQRALDSVMLSEMLQPAFERVAVASPDPADPRTGLGERPAEGPPEREMEIIESR